MSRPGSTQRLPLIGVGDRIRGLAGIALPFLAVLALEYCALLETALVMLFPNRG